MTKLTDKLMPIQILEPVANAFASAVASDYINMANYKSLVFMIYWGVGATGTQTITVKEATDVSGTGATAIPFNYRRVANTTSSDVPGARTAATSAGFTTTAGSNQMYLIEVGAEDLDSGFGFVNVNTTEVVASALLGGIMVLAGEPRYAGAVMPTALA